MELKRNTKIGSKLIICNPETFFATPLEVKVEALSPSGEYIKFDGFYKWLKTSRITLLEVLEADGE